MSLKASDVEEIMKLLEASRFDRLVLEMDGMKLELAREGAARRRTETVDAAPIRRNEPDPADEPDPAAEPPRASPHRPIPDGLQEVASPLLGVFYRAPKPGEPPFVEVGSRVAEDTVIGIVEVMKLMNSVRAGVRGEVVEIRAVNGDLIEHGETLMLVRPE